MLILPFFRKIARGRRSGRRAMLWILYHIPRKKKTVPLGFVRCNGGRDKHKSPAPKRVRGAVFYRVTDLGAGVSDLAGDGLGLFQGGDFRHGLLDGLAFGDQLAAGGVHGLDLLHLVAGQAVALDGDGYR